MKTNDLPDFLNCVRTMSTAHTKLPATERFKGGLTFLPTFIQGLFVSCALVASAHAGSTSYVTAETLGTIRNNYSGFLGMKITVGANPITVTALGRFCLSGNSTTHTVKLVNVTGGTDVAGGSVSIAMIGGTPGTFKYASLSSPVVLAAGTSYYLVSQETSGGDSWYHADTTVTTTTVATEVSSVYGSGGTVWNLYGTAGHTYGPLDFQYQTATTVNSWSLTGNSGTTAGANFLGTTDNQPLELHVNNVRAFRLEPTVNDFQHSNIVNVVNGAPINSVKTGVYGGTIAGGGAQGFNAGLGLIAYPNIVTLDFGTVGGGFNNTADYVATVGGGAHNTAAPGATVSGGDVNTASGQSATVCGGSINYASGQGAMIGGGRQNTASGIQAVVPGGALNSANGDLSLAAGFRSVANSPGQFVWADSYNADFNPNIYGFYNDSFCVRATGGSVWITSTAGTMGPYFIPGDLGWRSSCDEELKENFTPVDDQALLEKLSRMPITQWNAKAQSTEIKHIGPTAQDFHAAFGLGGNDDKSISTIDEGGVALAAIQGLQQKVESETRSLRAELKARDAEIADLRRQLVELAKLVKRD